MKRKREAPEYENKSFDALSVKFISIVNFQQGLLPQKSVKKSDGVINLVYDDVENTIKIKDKNLFIHYYLNGFDEKFNLLQIKTGDAEKNRAYYSFNLKLYLNLISFKIRPTLCIDRSSGLLIYNACLDIQDFVKHIEHQIFIQDVELKEAVVNFRAFRPFIKPLQLVENITLLSVLFTKPMTLKEESMIFCLVSFYFPVVISDTILC